MALTASSALSSRCSPKACATFARKWSIRSCMTILRESRCVTGCCCR